MIKEVKVVVIGSAGVGKSSIVLRFVADEFNPNMEATLGATFLEKNHKYNNKVVKFAFWDTAGQEKYKSIVRIYYREARVALVVYDISSKESFQSLKIWVDELRTHAPKNILIFIIGNKTDLDEQQVKYSDAEQFAASVGAILKLTSAKDSKGIKQLFDTVADRLEVAQNEKDKNETNKEQQIKKLNKQTGKKKKQQGQGGCC